MAASSLVVSAQPTSAAPGADSNEGKKSAEGADPRQAEEAMDRARRYAANPLRLIQEASRVRRRGEAESVVTALVAAGALPEPVTRSAAPRPDRLPSAQPVAVMNSVLTQTRAETGALTPPEAQALSSALQPTEVVLPPLAPLQGDLSRPTLISRIDLEFPPRVLVEIEPGTVVLADLTIRADGTVSDVAIVSPIGQALARYVLPALQRWRFEPLPSPRVWRVQVVYRAE
jgi:TonB family protein